jgi:hypothetical protein
MAYVVRQSVGDFSMRLLWSSVIPHEHGLAHAPGSALRSESPMSLRVVTVWWAVGQFDPRATVPRTVKPDYSHSGDGGRRN